MSSEFNQQGSGTLEQESTDTSQERADDIPSRISDDHDKKSDKRQSHLETGNAREEEKIEITVYDENLPDAKPVEIEIKSEDEGEDTPTLPLNKNKKKEFETSQEEEKVPIYIFPTVRLRVAWKSSSNVFQFVLKVISIIFSTLGWLCCVGGVPLMSLVMLIIGAVYIGDCYIEPNIPIYLVVSGLFGTLQHFLGVWTKYIPKESQGKMKVYRAYCKVVDHTIQGFLFVWFILGCIWVYGAYSKVEFNKFYEQEYCNKTVYYFAFWVLNLSFILMSLLVVVTLAGILYVVLTKEKSEDQ